MRLCLQVPWCLEGVLPPISLPAWGSHACLMEYTPQLTQLVQRGVDALAVALGYQVQVRGGVCGHL